jgi:hypothetical protein
MSKSKWIYLRDMAPKASVKNLETGEVREIISVGVKDRAPIGLRRYLLTETSGGQFEETGEYMTLAENEGLIDELEDKYRAPNSWIYDWPHLPTEAEGDADMAMRSRIQLRLEGMMSLYPYEFQLVGLQRRFLMYYSDGNYKSQQRFERYIPAPDASPFRRNWNLRDRYETVWNSVMRDASVPVPKNSDESGSRRPCLYLAPAWTVRFLLDGKDVLLDRCRVYVDDEANFLCSDWCQRHDHSSYNEGINLQMGLYSFDAWVTGPCLIKNVESGQFKSKTEFKRTAVRDLMKRAAPLPVDFDAAFSKAESALKKYAPPVKDTAQSVPAISLVDAGPLTADALAEAMKVATKIWKDTKPKLPKVKLEQRTVAEQPGVHANTGIHRRGDWYLVEITKTMKDDFDGATVVAIHPPGDHGSWVAATLLYTKPLQAVLEQDLPYAGGLDGFYVDDDSDTGFWYANYGSYEEGDEELSTHWWLYHAAELYRDRIMADESLQGQITGTLIGNG